MFALVANYVSEVETQVGDKIVVLELTKPVKANEAVPDDAVTDASPERWAPPTALRDRTQLIGVVAASDLQPRLDPAGGHARPPPRDREGEREVAILVDAATGVAGKIEPGRSST